METQERPSRRFVILIPLGVCLLCVVPLLLPIVIFLMKFGWPRMREAFEPGLEDLEENIRED